MLACLGGDPPGCARSSKNPANPPRRTLDRRESMPLPGQARSTATAGADPPSKAIEGRRRGHGPVPQDSRGASHSRRHRRRDQGMAQAPAGGRPYAGREAGPYYHPDGMPDRRPARIHGGIRPGIAVGEIAFQIRRSYVSPEKLAGRIIRQWQAVRVRSTRRDAARASPSRRAGSIRSPGQTAGYG